MSSFARNSDRARPPGASRSLSRQPSVVLLDLGDTMARADPSWRDVYAAVFDGYGIGDVPAHAFEAAFRAAWQDWAHDGPFEATEAASFDRLMALDRMVFERLGHPDLPESFYRDVERAFQQRSAFHVFPDTVPALRAMRAAGLRLGVISNWGWAAPELLVALDLARYFEVLSISARVGYQKPHPAIFRHALEQFGVSPEAAIHVGDDPAADVVGARGVGIEPVLIDRVDRVHPPIGSDTPPDGAIVIADLGELLDLLDIARPAELARTAGPTPPA